MYVDKKDLLILAHDVSNLTHGIKQQCFNIQEELKNEIPYNFNIFNYMQQINHIKKEIDNTIDIFYRKCKEE